MASYFTSSPQGARSSAERITLRCQGKTAAGRDCRRNIEYNLSQKHLKEPDWRSPEVYCHNHQDQAMDYYPSYASPASKRQTNVTKSSHSSSSQQSFSAQVHVHVEVNSNQPKHKTPKAKASRSSFRPSSSDDDPSVVDLTYSDEDHDDDDSRTDEDSPSPHPKRHGAKTTPAKSKPPRSGPRAKPRTEGPPNTFSTPQSKPQAAAKINASAPPKFNPSVVQEVSRLSHDSLLEKLSLLNLNDKKPSPAAAVAAARPTTPSPAGRKSPSWAVKMCCFVCVSVDTQEEEEAPRPSRPRPSAEKLNVAVPKPRIGSSIPPPNAKTAAALSKVINSPPSDADRPGYIYIFRHKPTLNGVRSADKTPINGKLLLKIGRAENVHERMSQWERQCQLPIQLLRYYPQANSAGNRRQGPKIQDSTPHAKKVEARIHLELRELHAKLDACPGCNQTHTEWFWIDDTVEAVQEVDQLIRRVIAWDYEMTAQSSEWRFNEDSAALVNVRR